jgi:hypothetical protein
MDPILVVQMILMLGRIILPIIVLVGIMCLGEVFRRRAEKKKKREDLF